MVGSWPDLLGVWGSRWKGRGEVWVISAVPCPNLPPWPLPQQQQQYAPSLGASWPAQVHFCQTRKSQASLNCAIAYLNAFVVHIWMWVKYGPASFADGDVNCAPLVEDKYVFGGYRSPWQLPWRRLHGRCVGKHQQSTVGVGRAQGS